MDEYFHNKYNTIFPVKRTMVRLNNLFFLKKKSHTIVWLYINVLIMFIFYYYCPVNF